MTPLPFVGSDEDLIEALDKGHPGAANAFYDRYAEVVDRILSRVVGPDAELPELIQDAFLGAIAGAPRLRDPSRLPAFVSAAAVAVARRHLRRRARARAWTWVRSLVGRGISKAGVTFDDPPWHHGTAANGVARSMHAFYVALDELPVEERIVLALRVVDAMSPAEIAEVTGSSLGRMRRRSRRAEARFVAVARKSAELGPWLDRSARWSLPTLG